MELICDKKFLKGLIQSIYLIGGLFSLFCGYFSDRFGRKPTLFMLTLLLTIVNVLSELSQLEYFALSSLFRYVMYCICQFLTGAISKCK